MGIIRGTPYRINNISSADPVEILSRNPNRGGLLIEAAAGNAGNIAISFDDPAVTVTGDKSGLLLAANDQYVEAPPDANSGAVYVISANGTEDILVREDFKND